MARFKLINLQLLTIKAGTRAGKKYFYADLLNLNDPFAKRLNKYLNFDPSFVTLFEPLLPTSVGGTALTEQPIPAELSTITGCMIDYKPPTLFHKKYLTTNAQYGTIAGEYVKDSDGTAIVYDTLRVFCRYYLDENGKQAWADGESPEEAGRAAFSSYCVAVTPGITHIDPTTPPDHTKDNTPPTTGLPPANPGMRWAEVNGQMMQVPIQQ